MTAEIIHGDSLEIMRGMEDNSVDAVITDPPYGLSALTGAQIADVMVKWATGDRDYMPTGKGFMGKSWDAFVPPPALWDEALRVLKPGGHLLAFAGTRTQDLMGLSIRLAGFEIRDNLAWLYGSGFPKSLDVSKAIDKAAGAEREVIGSKITGNAKQRTSATGEFADGKHGGQQIVDVTAPATPAAQEWQGWGTALKPAFEPIIMARKPLTGTVAQNVLLHRTGALNIDACRIGYAAGEDTASVANGATKFGGVFGNGQAISIKDVSGRWPANVALDENMAQELDEQSGESKSAKAVRSRVGDVVGNGHTHGTFVSQLDRIGGYDDNGGASRFFYVAKAPKKERPVVDGVAHPTVKPLALMRWLVRLVTPEGGVVLDPFAGSGTTVEAAILEGFQVIGIEREAEYLPLIQARIERAA